MLSFLKLNNVSGGYDRQDVIKNVSLDIKRGDFLGIIGPNGSGKSTLLRLISRVIKPTEGNMLLGGRDIESILLKDFSRAVAFVGQDTVVNFSYSVWEIVLMGRIPHLKRLQLEGRIDFEIAKDALNLTDTFSLREKPITNLSAGERQRVIIAKALTQEPQLLILDEPLSHLDIGHQIQILSLLKKFNKENNLTLVMVFHDLNLAAEYCDRLVLINDGKIFKEGTAAEVITYQNIEEVYRTLVIVETNPISHKPYVFVVPK